MLSPSLSAMASKHWSSTSSTLSRQVALTSSLRVRHTRTSLSPTRSAQRSAPSQAPPLSLATRTSPRHIPTPTAICGGTSASSVPLVSASSPFCSASTRSTRHSRGSRPSFFSSAAPSPTLSTRRRRKLRLTRRRATVAAQRYRKRAVWTSVR